MWPENELGNYATNMQVPVTHIKFNMSYWNSHIEQQLISKKLSFILHTLH